MVFNLSKLIGKLHTSVRLFANRQLLGSILCLHMPLIFRHTDLSLRIGICATLGSRSSSNKSTCSTEVSTCKYLHSMTISSSPPSNNLSMSQQLMVAHDIDSYWLCNVSCACYLPLSFKCILLLVCSVRYNKHTKYEKVNTPSKKGIR